MVDPYPIPSTSTFVIRLWKEYSSSGSRWRGWIKHIQSGQRATFQDDGDMFAFMRSFGVTCIEDSQSEKLVENDLALRDHQ